MKRTFTYLLCAGIFIFLGGAQKSFAQKSLQTAINNYIGKEAKSQEAAEYKEARKIVSGDLDGDGDRDAAVQYTLEGMGGGNSFAQMLAVFRNDKGVYKFAAEEVIGGKMSDRTATLTNISNRKILLSTESCPDVPQGMCKNPKKRKASFVFRGSKLKEL